MNTDVNVITCEHLTGKGKDSGKEYDFYTGQAFVLGAVVKYSSSVLLVPDIAKVQKLKVTLQPQGDLIRVKLDKPA